MKSVHALVASVLALPLAACSASTGGDQAPRAGDDTVVMLTHESFKLPKKLLRQFEEDSGYRLEVRKTGDAGALTTRLVLTVDDPTGDVAFGVDNTFASRALEAGVFDEHGVTVPDPATGFALPGGEDRLVPVDTGAVCVNVDTTWFEKQDLDPPETLEDLADPAYEGLFVTASALSSSPGLAFLLATVAEFGEEWPAYWERLMANDTLVVDGWSDAYFGEFTQGGAEGTRPIVLSYDSSPAFTVGDDGTSTTAALLDTCFEQVEYAGMLAGTENPAGARAALEFLLSEEVQEALPTSMYVFPVTDAPLPADWQRHAERPDSPASLEPAEISENREAWLEEWRDVVTR